jgi:uncharacterized Zn finger protein (UPF0148 family)
MIGTDDPTQPQGDAKLDKLGHWPEGTWLQHRLHQLKLAQLLRKGATMNGPTCPKCKRVHGNPNERHATCPACHHLYPVKLFEGGFRNIDCCVYCADRMQDTVEDARRDAALDDREEED